MNSCLIESGLVDCPFCGGDGCDPNDYSTAVVADCPACNGHGRVTSKAHELIRKGIEQKWTWQRFYEERKADA